MSGSNTGSTVTQSNNTAPWTGAQPTLTKALTEAGKLYDAGIGFNPYSGPAFIPPTQQEMEGLGLQEGIARAGNPFLGSMLANANNQFATGGIDPGQGQLSLNNLHKIALGQYSIEETPLGRDNADFRNLVDQTTRRGVDEATGLFSGHGRYGGGMHQQGVQETAGNIAGGMFANQYNQDVQNRTQQRAANIANVAGASNSVLDQLGAGQQRALGWGALAPQMNELRYADPSRLINIGAGLRGELQDENEAYKNLFDQQQAAGINRVNWLAGIGGGMGGLGSQTTTTAPQGSRIAGLLGGAAMGGGLGSTIMPGIGTGVGAGLGGLLGLFA